MSIWDSWESAARWVVDQMPAGKFALAGLSLGGMLAVEIMQFAAERVTKLALLDTGVRGQNEAERAIRRARIRLADEGHFELVLGLQMSRFIPAYRLPDKTLVDAVMAMCGEIGVEIYKRQEALAGDPRRPPARPAEDQVPDHRGVRPRRCGDAAVSLRGDRGRDQGQRADRHRAVRASDHDGEARGDERDLEEVARPRSSHARDDGVIHILHPGDAGA